MILTGIETKVDLPLFGQNEVYGAMEVHECCPERMETKDDENARKQKYVSWTNENGKKKIHDEQTLRVAHDES